MSRRARWLVLGFALAGLALAVASSWVHYRLLTDPTYVSPCDINQTFNCTQVYLSRFGTVHGVPVALGGVLWFSLVALVAGLHRSPGGPGEPEGKRPAGERDAVGGYLFALATIGLAVILYLGYASFMILKTGCLLCIGTYVCVLAIFITTGLSASGGISDVPARLVGDLRRTLARPAMLVVVILYIVGATSLLAWFPKEARPQAPAPTPVSADIETRFAEIWAKQQRVDLGVPADGAKVVIVKFNDWMCPACKAYQMAYQPILDKYAQSDPGAVKVVVKDWPWNTACNFKAPQTFVGHEASCQAAVAVRIARDHGKAEDMVSWLFANQERLGEIGRSGPDAVNEIRAETLRLVGSGVDFDHEYAVKLADIRRDVADGSLLNVNATPTYFIDGVRTADQNGNSMPAQYFDLAIKLELKRAAAR
jgi:uncharacterized membrane protein/protein-disulfide isomerase